MSGSQEMITGGTQQQEFEKMGRSYRRYQGKEGKKRAGGLQNYEALWLRRRICDCEKARSKLVSVGLAEKVGSKHGDGACEMIGGTTC